MPVVRVALPVPLNRTFDYLSDGDCQPGCRVRVPFGRRQLIGIVMECGVIPDCGPEQMKPIQSCLDAEPALASSILELCRFTSEYYCQPIGELVHQALPTWLRDGGSQEDLDERVWRRSCAEPPSLRSEQARLLWKNLENPATEAQLRELSARSAHWLKRWQAEGLVERVEAPPPPWACEGKLALNDEQAAAVRHIVSLAGRFQPVLLAGVTGSGKTEVYLHAMEDALRRNRQVLVLVPEINLTPQLQARFEQRFPGLPLVCLHSRLADKERANNWRRAARGQARLVVGTRLALFTPLPELGLIIADEEHDGSYRQQDGLRFSARDLAIWRARQADVPIVLGSATPALESWNNAVTQRYSLLRLTERAVGGARLPDLRLIDIRRHRNDSIIAPELRKAIALRLERGEQSLLFVNRRGYAPVLFCDACGWMSACTRCSVRLVVHLADRRLRCHHCGLEQAVPRACPGCGHLDIKPVGQGTQRLEQQLGDLFPHARIARVDRDSTRNKGSFAQLLEDAADGTTDILVGTQMLAKGHDLPRLTLVGIINADSGLFAPDYRAPERMFAQLLQVAGRAGRHQLPGEVLLQTRFPDHPLYQAWLTHDWESYAQQMLTERQEARFPPFYAHAVLRAEARDRERLQRFLQAAAQLIAPLDGVELCDPVDSLPAKIDNRYRMQLLVQSPSRPHLRSFLSQWWPLLQETAPSGIKWGLDVDPCDV